MTDGESTSNTGPPSRDTVHELLADERRRVLLDCLAEHGPLVLPDLADEVARAEHDAPLPRIPEDEVLRVYLSLWHSHVPKLSDAAVVSYEQDRDLVALGETATAVSKYTSVDLATDGGSR